MKRSGSKEEVEKRRQSGLKSNSKDGNSK